ncbi:MAG: cysteine rich repeat-containing protein [Pseudolabrys sp.]
MLKPCAIAALAIMAAIVSPLSALAYTQQDADACTPDAMRLCQNAIPDEARVAHCLAQNKRNLSPACQIVFSRPATARRIPAGTMPAAGRPLDIHPTDY